MIDNQYRDTFCKRLPNPLLNLLHNLRYVKLAIQISSPNAFIKIVRCILINSKAWSLPVIIALILCEFNQHLLTDTSEEAPARADLLHLMSMNIGR